MGKGCSVFSVAVIGGLLLGIGGCGSAGSSGPPVLASTTVFLSEPVSTILPVRAGRRGLLVGTEKSLYFSADEGAGWTRIFWAGIWGRTIHSVVVDPVDRERLFVAAGDGLFVSGNWGKSWSKLFSGKGEILCVAAGAGRPAALFVGSVSGAYRSIDGGASWGRVSSGLPAGPILSVVWDSRFGGRYYAQIEEGIFRFDPESVSWQRVWVRFSSGLAREGLETEIAEEPEEEEPAVAGSLVLEPVSGGLYVASGSSVFASFDRGDHWEPLSGRGMGAAPVRKIIPDSGGGRLIALTFTEIFQWDPVRLLWNTLERPVSAKMLQSAAVSLDGRFLWIGSREGLFRAPFLQPMVFGWNGLRREELKDSNGPSIRELQQAAIRYAEVDPKKIGDWRRRAELSGWIPRVSFSVNCDRNRTIASSTSNGKTNFFIGPEDQSARLGVDLSWQLGNLIWNPDQTTIDARSRLMVQLREEVLGEVTRLYFERRRLEEEFLGNPSDDRRLLSERQLRVEELEAQMDALTGGYFSEMKAKNGQI